MSTGRFAGLEAVLSDVVAWQAAQFPEATPKGIASHLLDELYEWAGTSLPIDEALRRLDDRKEMADVIMLIVAYAVIRDIDIVAAVRDKLAINKARTWPVEATNGRYDHIKTEAAND